MTGMSISKGTFYYSRDRLTPSKALDISRGGLKGKLNEETVEKVNASRGIVDHILEEDKVVYGINTGFGTLCRTIISKENTQKLQDNLIRSHSVGVGEPVPLSIARLMLILKIQSLAFGYSGISMQVLERLLWLLEKDYIPYVPTKGSLGASGDLAPLAHLFLPLIGLGKLHSNGNYTDTETIYTKEGISPLILKPKEGLALINGTQFITAYTIEILEKLFVCLESADIIGAMSLEGILGSCMSSGLSRAASM
jgi:histidine ammonia-lyase